MSRTPRSRATALAVGAALALAAVPGALAGGSPSPTQLVVGGQPIFGSLSAGATAPFVLTGDNCSNGWLAVSMWDVNRMTTLPDDHADPLLIWRQGSPPQVNVTNEPRITLLQNTNGDIEGEI